MAESEDYEEKPDRDEDDGQESFHDSSEESDDEEQDVYDENDGFIVNDVEADGVDVPPPREVQDEDEDEIQNLKRKKKKKKKRHYREEDLDEIDLELVEQHGFHVDRSKQKRLKRLKKSAPEDDRDEEVDEDLRNLNREEEDNYDDRRRRVDEPVDFDDEMYDFIDDGDRGKRRNRTGPGFVSSEAVRTARSIFGDIDEMSQFQGSGKSLGGGEVEDEDEDEDEDYVPGAPDGRRRRTDEPGEPGLEGDGSNLRRPEPATDDNAIAKGLTGPVDDKDIVEKIVEVDIPERLQYHFHASAQAPSEAQIRDEANWIYRKGFLENPKFRGNIQYQSDEVVDKIVVLLSYIHIDKLDIPFIAMYRQDYVSSLLVTQSAEIFREEPLKEEEVEPRPMAPPRGFNSVLYNDFQPGLSFEHLRGVPRGYDDGFGDWSILWLVLDLDKKYATLSRRRNALLDAVEEARIKGVPGSVLDDVRTLAHSCDDEKDLRDGERHLRLAIDLANSLNSSRVVDDSDDENNSRRTRRPSRRRNRYAEFCKRGYRSLTKEIGINARQFGENLKGVCDYGAGSQVHVPLDSDGDPREAAKLIAIRSGEMAVESSEQLIDRVLSASRFILVTEIVTDLAVLQATRQLLFRPGAVTISTKPTLQGIAQVDDTHPLRCVTSLCEKKIEDFKGTADFALIRRAVELGFTNLEISFREDQVNTFQMFLEASIVVDSSTSNFIAEWNEQRKLVTADVHRLLISTMIAKVRDELEEETSQVLRCKLMNSASRRFMLGPAQVYKDNGCPRVLAFCVTTEDDEEPDSAQVVKDADDAKNEDSASKRRIAHERISIVELDENGEYCNGHEMFAAWLRRPMRKDVENNQLPKSVKEQLRNILHRSRAQVVVVGVGSGRRAPIRLHADLLDVIKEMAMGRELPAFLENNAVLVDAIKSLPGDPNDEAHKNVAQKLSQYVIFVDEAPCRIYAKTKWASAGLSMDGMTLLEKRTVGIGRLAQEPLWVYCAIGHDKDLSSRMQFHTYHFYANPADRLIALTRALVRAVCAVGVDVNRSLRLPHTQSMIAYVGGLGIHKGAELLKRLGNILIEEERGVMSRKDLWSQKFIGRIVFLSAAAFLRVRDPELHPGGSTKLAIEFRRSRMSRRFRNNNRHSHRDDDGTLFDPRDDSRIHPEHYMVAGKIADESLRDDRGKLNLDISESDEYSKELMMTAAVMDNPKGLGSLDLHKYAQHLADLNRGSLFETVKMIANEFRKPFQDWRRPLVNPDPEALFYLVSGADPVLLRVGSLVTGTSCFLRKKRTPSQHGSYSGVSCLLPMNIRGFIPMKDFADDNLPDEAIERLVPEGSSIPSRITKFEYKRFEASLVSKVSMLEDPVSVPGYVPVVDKSDAAFRPYPKKDDVNGILGGGLGQTELALKQRNLQRRMTMDHLRSTSKAVLQHPLFKNVDGDQATVELRSALPGEILIRPSQYNKSDIVISCKFASLPESENESRTLLHIPCHVIEGNSNNQDNGVENVDDGEVRFKIGSTSFEHIDQALEEHVRPILSNLSEAIDHRKFMGGSANELKKYVQDLKHKSPNAIPYIFGLSANYASGLVLVFIPGSKSVATEEIVVVPHGYKFRRVLHIQMDKLISWFKQNMMRGIGIGFDGKGEPGRRPGSIRAPAGVVGIRADTGVVNTGSVGGFGVGVGTAPGSVRDGGMGMGGGPTPVTVAPAYQSPYHAPPRSPFVGSGPAGGGHGNGGGSLASGMAPSNMGMGMGMGMGEAGSGMGMGGMGMPPVYGSGGGEGSMNASVAPVRDSAPPPAPVGGNAYEGMAGRGYENGGGAASGNMNERTDWSRAIRQRDEPPPVPAPMGRGGPMGGGSDGGGGGRGGGRGGKMEDESGGAAPWRGQAPVPAWKKAQMDAQQQQQ